MAASAPVYVSSHGKPDPDWLALPADALQRIILLASTWQRPGSCLLASVCRSWSAAAAHCKGICLLYYVPWTAAPAKDANFAAWLARNIHHLGASTIGGWKWQRADALLLALADAISAAAAAGAPPPLHTLLILRARSNVDIVMSRLMASLQHLPNLRHLQLSVLDPNQFRFSDYTEQMIQQEVVQHLAPLKQATQLRELHLIGPRVNGASCVAAVAELLPVSLRRLTWQASCEALVPSLCHLTQLTFLRLSSFRGGYSRTGYGGDLRSSLLPPSVQQLEVEFMPTPWQVLEEQQQAVTSVVLSSHDPLRVSDVTSLSKLKSIGLSSPEQCSSSAADLAAWAQLGALSRLSLSVSERPGSGAVPVVVPTALSIRGLRSLCLSLDMYQEWFAPVLKGLGALTGVTQLILSTSAGNPGRDSRVLPASLRGLAEELQQMAALRWLQVEGALLLAEPGCLARLAQLRVLELTHTRYQDLLQCLEGYTAQMLPPTLRVLSIPGDDLGAEPQRHLGQLMRSHGGELVVGMDMEWVFHPAQQMAGVPLWLQQALA